MKELAAALCKAQAQIEGATKGKVNPAFRSKYADLASVWDACREALTTHGLSVAQFGRTTEAGAVLVTRLLHVSGEFLEGEVPLLNSKGDMQGLGSALTYARRYGLAAMVGVSPEDDDANAASNRTEPKAPAAKVEPAKPAGYDEWLADFTAAADTGLAALAEAWQGAKPEYRTHANATDPHLKDRLKAKATRAA